MICCKQNCTDKTQTDKVLAVFNGIGWIPGDVSTDCPSTSEMDVHLCNCCVKGHGGEVRSKGQ